MHISEGILSSPVLVTGAALAAGGSAVGLKKLDYERVPQVSILSAVFFVASLIHVPIGPSSVHLILNGLVGILLGWVAFPAILVALMLQAVLFQFGGITTLGVNCLNMALPSALCFYALRPGVRSASPIVSMAASFACGFCAVLLAGLMVALSLAMTGRPFLAVAKLVLVAHVPIMIVEGLITAFCVRFLKQIKPEMLEVTYAR